jgi:exodeoxyribonuclease V alpha subunit
VARAFADTIERLHGRMGGEAADASTVGEWAQQAWRAASDGHVCVEIDDSVRAALAASPAVTTRPGGRAAPLVLDDRSLYLHRLWRAEVRLAQAVAALDSPAPAAAPQAIDRVLDALFPGAGGERAVDDPQRLAAKAALTRRLAVVTGGPGTGKTTTLARLLVAFLRAVPQARVCFAAPTGKAAARLAASLASQLPTLDPGGELSRRLPVGGVTVHRLLGTLANGEGRGAPPPPPLAWDMGIVDEASMLDIELACRLAVAIPPHGRLVLAGDADQLASVEAGAVFSELCASGIAGVQRLHRNYRQLDAPRVVGLAAAVREGSPEQTRAAAQGLCAAQSARSAQLVAAAMREYEPAIDAALRGADAAGALEAFDRHRVLVALRDGEWGAAALNRAIAAQVRRRAHAAPQAPWYPGRLVMVTRNDPGLGLFNGDVGVCMRADGGLAVAFAGPSAGPRWVPILQMPECDDAFAITVHKSQGSEFESVSLVPAPAGHPLNTRELVYTGVTRARRSLQVWADVSVLGDAAGRPTVRDGRLAERIRLNAAARAGEGAASAAKDPFASPP